MESRPFQIIVLFVFGFLAVVGLFLFANYSGFGNGSGAVGGVTIWGTVPSSQVKAGLDLLTQTRKEFKDVGYIERPSATFDSDLANAIASGSGPDMVLLTQEQLLFERSKITLIPFSSISQRDYVSSYVPLAELMLSTAEGGFYGIPYLVDPLVLYYNRSILNTAGVGAPPTTWEAVSGLAQSLTLRNDDQTIVRSTIALGEYGNVHNARALLSLFLLQAGAPITKSTSLGIRADIAGELSATSAPGAVAPGVAAMNFYTQFANPAKTVYTWNRSLPASRQEFLAGDTALYIGFASERPFLTSANPNLDFDMAPIPQPGVSSSAITYGTLYAFAIPKASKNPAGAFSAALALSDAEPLLSVARASSMAPARRELLVPGQQDLFSPIFYPQALVSRAWLSPLPSDTDSVFSSMISDITSGRRDTADAVRTAEQALNAKIP